MQYLTNIEKLYDYYSNKNDTINNSKKQSILKNDNPNTMKINNDIISPPMNEKTLFSF